MRVAAQPRTIAVAIGDPNGIGPEIAVKAARRSAGRPDIRVVLVGDSAVVRWYAARCAPGCELREIVDPLGVSPRRDVIDVVAVETPAGAAFAPGIVDARAGAATLAYVRAAHGLLVRGSVAAIVACPHSETAVNASGIRFAGYPAYLAELCGVPRDRVFLLLIGGGLRIVHATLHERLADALARLDAELVEDAALAAVEALRTLGIAAPRIGVFGINPHAGEGGLFGSDDERVGAPAVARLRGRGIAVDGPAGADVMLGRDDIDAYVAMYHDQGHIPVKLRAGRGATALAVGAGVLFASVGHGSAFDIAGAGQADPAPLLAALDLLGSTVPSEVSV